MRCGGTQVCAGCSLEAVRWQMAGAALEPEVLLGDNTANYQARAMEVVRNYIFDQTKRADNYNMYVVWFSKTLKNWKAIVCTSYKDGMMYEVTHNGEAGETYLDAYKKTDNVVYPD